MTGTFFVVSYSTVSEIPGQVTGHEKVVDFNAALICGVLELLLEQVQTARQILRCGIHGAILAYGARQRQCKRETRDRPNLGRDIIDA
jgi:hypothetical protein